ncbi:MAG: transposase family [Planctomycetota bacterium]|nr:MAG: transposase family [Planctomycetota bacterium]
MLSDAARGTEFQNSRIVLRGSWGASSTCPTPSIPDSYEKTAIEYGWYSNRTRGYRKEHGLLKADPPERKDPAADSDKASLHTRRAWARLIAKGYEVNPLLCPRCGSEMKVVAVIDQEDAVYKILRHLGLLAPE